MLAPLPGAYAGLILGGADFKKKMGWGGVPLETHHFLPIVNYIMVILVHFLDFVNFFPSFFLIFFSILAFLGGA